MVSDLLLGRNGRFGEDAAFLADCRAAGFATKLDPSIDVGHCGDREFAGSFAKALAELAGALEHLIP